MKLKVIKSKDYLLLVDEEAEIKEEKLVVRVYEDDIRVAKSLPNSDNLKRLKDKRVFLLIAYHPLNSEAKELDLPLLPNPFEDNFNDLEWDDIADEDWKSRGGEGNRSHFMYRQGYIHGAYKALQTQSKQFSLEDMKKAFEEGSKHKYVCEANGKDKKCYCRNDNECNFRHYMTAEEFIQSISTQQLPKEFEPRMYPKYTQYDGFEEDDEIPVMTPMTFTNSEGKQELVGTWKFNV